MKRFMAQHPDSRALAILSIVSLLFCTTVTAHVSEQGFVLLMPTHVYISAGVVAVVLTLLALALLPVRISHKLFSDITLSTANHKPVLRAAFSFVSFLLLCALIVIGFIGNTDPLENLLPLTIWTVFWIALLSLHGLFGNLWRCLNPWTGPVSLTRKALGLNNEPPFKLPAVGAWPAVIILILFGLFMLADTAPDAPVRLSYIVALYWLLTYVGMLLFGEEAWGRCAELFTVIASLYAALAPFAVYACNFRVGFPGWRLFQHHAKNANISTGVFCLLLLGIGSFDGLNETFWWLSHIGINPLEFPGRSVVQMQTVAGMLLCCALLVTVFAFCVLLGMKLARSDDNNISFTRAFSQLAVSVLPIAFAYHIAHFLTAFLTNIQYTVAAISDPLSNGADLLRLGQFYVSTGFLNHHASVEFIWLSQASVVVAGHTLSVMLAHAIAVELYGSTRRAVLSQLPLASFMVLYTFLGLWLLAAPKGA